MNDSDLNISIKEEHAREWIFGNSLDQEWTPFCEGFRYRLSHGRDTQGSLHSPGTKQLGLYPENQNQRISWERGWIAADVIQKLFVVEPDPPTFAERINHILRYTWNPIGVSDLPEDEYFSYVPMLQAAILRHEPDLVQMLTDMETTYFGSKEPCGRAETAAKALYALVP